MLAPSLSCGGAGDSVPNPTLPDTPSLGVTAVSVMPQITWNTVPGGTRNFTANVTATSEMPSSGWPTVWASSDQSVATVAANGTATAVAPGTATISATVGGVKGTQVVNVLAQPGVISIILNASDGSTLFLGDSLPLEVTHTLLGTIPPGGLVTTWASSNTSVLTVSATGMVKGLALGTATVTATSYGKTASVQLTVVAKPPTPPPPPVTGITGMTIVPSVVVVAPGGEANFVAFVTATTNPPTDGLGWPVVWTSSNPAIVLPNYPNAPHEVMEFFPPAEGTSTITASLGGVTATASLYVATPLSLTVTPTAPTLAAGQTQQLTATVPSTGPLPASGYPVAYTSSSPLVATVDSTGLITAHAFGKTHIYASALPKSATVDVTVTGPTPTMNIVAADTVKGTAVATTGGYTLSCNFTWSAAPTGTGLVRFGKWEESLDGTTFFPTNTNAFLVLAVDAGQTAPGMGTSGTGPVAPTAGAVAAWDLTMRFHYAVNADIADYGNYATDYYVDHKFTCAP